MIRKYIRRIRFVFNVRRFAPFLVDFFKSRQVPLRSKLLSVSLIALYFVFPFDALPDFLGFFGLFDDFVFLTWVMQWIVGRAPQEMKEQHGFDATKGGTGAP